MLSAPGGWGRPPQEEAGEVTAGPLLSWMCIGDACELPQQSPRRVRRDVEPGRLLRGRALGGTPWTCMNGQGGAPQGQVGKRAEGKGAAELGVIQVSPSPVESMLSLRHSADSGPRRAVGPDGPQTRPLAPPGQSCRAVSSNKRPQPLTAQRSAEPGHRQCEVHSIQPGVQTGARPAPQQSQVTGDGQGQSKSCRDHDPDPKGARSQGS